MSARRDSKVEKKGYVDTRYSSGDCKETQKSQDKSAREQKETKYQASIKYQEENNNDVDGLSKELQMGCIVDSVKRPPNICVETCVYEGSDSDASNNEEEEEDAYSEEFEEDHSDVEDTVKTEVKSPKSETTQHQEERPPSSVKLSKSQSFMTSKQTLSVSGKSRSSQYGSLRVPRTRRVNMSFTNDRLREIERHNHILLNKILSARNVAKSSIPAAAPPAPAPRAPPAPAALHRKKQQRQIDHENMILLRKIQRAKSSACSLRR